MNYGFLIRNDRCIGCHACSTACKSENEVPLGVHRTWVKTVETGAFPDVRRHFQVTRCNHCDRPPCVEICPTRAMYRRDDGIVEFDTDRCIGCKACLQACPYDAIHIDPGRGTAAKCHFCSHRVELGMEPPCVVVCPEHAIVAGDLDDPGSEISRMLASHQVTVRKPEQGTRPKLFYVDGEEAALHPGATEPDPSGYAWADGPETNGTRAEAEVSGGPIRIGRGRVASEMVQTVYDVEHRVPWHWPVPAYLVTKGIAAGLFTLLAGAYLVGLVPFHEGAYLVGGFLVLLFTGLTTGLLVTDLERPERFLWVLLRPQWKSWLVRGAWVLIAFTGLVGGWWAVEMAAWLGWASPERAGTLRPWLLAGGIPIAGLVATYTAFLFGQAEGRDLWQSTLLPFHLLAQALIAGASVLLLLPFAGPPPELAALAAWVLLVTLSVESAVLLPGELGVAHGTDSAREAADRILWGPFRLHFWCGVVGVGHLLPIALLGAAAWVGAEAAGDLGETVGIGAAMWSASPWAVTLTALAGLAALIGLYLYEHAYVMAPQRVRNS